MKFKYLILFLTFFFFINSCSFGFSLFKKKHEPQKEKMVETKQEWEIEAQNVPLEERKLNPYKAPESNEKIIYPNPHFVFELYNNPPGSRELNIEDIKKNFYSYPYIVSDNKCHYVAYPRYYYTPQTNQISSEFFIGKLDTTKNKTRRMLDYNHNQTSKDPIIQAGMKEYYPNLFNGLSLVDWSKDGKRLLIKEKTGSTLNGIYKTYLYVHFMENEVNRAYTLKLDNLDRIIKRYYLDYQNLHLVKYRYDVEPLGFSEDNDDIIVVLAYVYDKENNKLFLGMWGYNTSTNEIMLFSKDNTQVAISANGLILVKSTE